MIQLEDNSNSTITQKLHFLTDAAGGLCSDTLALPFVKNTEGDLFVDGRTL